MLEWLEGKEQLPDNSKLPEIVDMLLAIQYSKEKDYGSSWKARGEHRGIIPNVDRKYDRLDQMTMAELEGKLKPLREQEELLKSNYELYASEVGESKIDAIADLAVYCLLYMTYVKENYPNVFKVWVERNVPKG